MDAFWTALWEWIFNVLLAGFDLPVFGG